MALHHVDQMRQDNDLLGRLTARAAVEVETQIADHGENTVLEQIRENPYGWVVQNSWALVSEDTQWDNDWEAYLAAQAQTPVPEGYEAPVGIGAIPDGQITSVIRAVMDRSQIGAVQEITEVTWR